MFTAGLQVTLIWYCGPIARCDCFRCSCWQILHFLMPYSMSWCRFTQWTYGRALPLVSSIPCICLVVQLEGWHFGQPPGWFHLLLALITERRVLMECWCQLSPYLGLHIDLNDFTASVSVSLHVSSDSCCSVCTENCTCMANVHIQCQAIGIATRLSWHWFS